MQESDTYLAMLDEGAEKHAKKAIFRQGQKRLALRERLLFSP